VVEKQTGVIENKNHSAMILMVAYRSDNIK